MIILFVGIRLLMYMLSLAHLDAELRVAPVREAQREPEALETCQQAQDGRALPRALAAAAV